MPTVNARRATRKRNRLVWLGFYVIRSGFNLLTAGFGVCRESSGTADGAIPERNVSGEARHRCQYSRQAVYGQVSLVPYPDLPWSVPKMYVRTPQACFVGAKGQA